MFLTFTRAEDGKKIAMLLSRLAKIHEVNDSVRIWEKWKSDDDRLTYTDVKESFDQVMDKIEKAEFLFELGRRCAP